MKNRIILYVIVFFCGLSISAQTNKPDYSININNQALLDKYFTINSADVLQCTTGKTTVMVTSVPYDGRVDCPPSRVFRIKTNRFLLEHNLMNEIVFLFVNLADCNLRPFVQITDEGITKKAPFILIFDKTGKLIKWYKYPGFSEMSGILDEILQLYNRDKSGSGDSKITRQKLLTRLSNPIVIKQVHSADDFPVMYKNLIGLPYDFRDSNISEIKSYCRSNNYVFTDYDYFIQVYNPVSEIFGINFDVRIYERDTFTYYNGKPSRMYLEWYTRKFSSIEKLNSKFKKFTDEIEKAGGVFKGYAEACHRSIYIFPNGVEVLTKAWEDDKAIQLDVIFPGK